MKKTIGIITIHRIFNYGSVLQAYALQHACEEFGYNTEIIDYVFPNAYHQNQRKIRLKVFRKIQWKKILLKCFYLKALYFQHKSIKRFIDEYLNLSSDSYLTVQEIKDVPPIYDIYITGSDQVWNPKYCYGDSTFFLDFVPGNHIKIAYAASFGSANIDKKYNSIFSQFLKQYDFLSVRENSGNKFIKNLIGIDVPVTLDPTLLLNVGDWNKISCKKRLIPDKYILCYYLNYSFNAFPYADNLARYVQQETGYKIVYVARPPQNFFNGNSLFKVDASPEEFLSLVRDAEIVLTTSFHGTAFAVNYQKPLFSIVEDQNSTDSRQIDLLTNIGLKSRILSIKDQFPPSNTFICDYELATLKLSRLRSHSLKYLFNSISDGNN